MRLLRTPTFLAIALSHLSVDSLNGHVGIILAALSGPLGLTNASLGLLATLYFMTNALTQPLFGWLSDKYGARWFVAGGVLWMAIFFSLFAATSGWISITFLILAALGSAAFHPPGTSRASQIGQLQMAGRAATAASLFFLFGQAGLALGPALGGFILDHLDRIGLLLTMTFVVPVGLFAAWQLRTEPNPVSAPNRKSHVDVAAPRADLPLFFLILLVSGFGTWAQMAATTFTPKFLHDQGASPTTYGLVVAMYMVGSALGGLTGGILGDHWGKLRTVTLASTLAAIPFYFLPLANGFGVNLLAMLAGLFNGAPHSILITMAQRALPGRGSLASGLALGFMFTAGTLGSYLSGLIADSASLTFALQLNAAIALISALLSLLLRLKRPTPVIFPLPTGD